MKERITAESRVEWTKRMTGVRVTDLTGVRKENMKRGLASFIFKDFHFILSLRAHSHLGSR